MRFNTRTRKTQDAQEEIGLNPPNPSLPLLWDTVWGCVEKSRFLMLDDVCKHHNKIVFFVVSQSKKVCIIVYFLYFPYISHINTLYCNTIPWYLKIMFMIMIMMIMPIMQWFFMASLLTFSFSFLYFYFFILKNLQKASKISMTKFSFRCK